MTNKSKDTESEIYLGKANKIHGPFSSAELDEMATSGKLSSYVWIWDHREEQWKPIETPPPSPMKTAKVSGKTAEFSSDSALCYDHFNTVNGVLDEITETGCVLLSNHSGAAPRFALKSQISVSTIDSKKKTTKKVKAKIIEIARKSNKWSYRLRWISPR